MNNERAKRVNLEENNNEKDDGERWDEMNETLAYLLSEISIDEKTAKFAVRRFTPEWIRGAVSQAKSGDRPKGLFCWLMRFPEKVRTPAKKQPATSGGHGPRAETQTETPATDAEISDAVSSIIERLGGASTKKGLRNDCQEESCEEEGYKEKNRHRHRNRRGA